MPGSKVSRFFDGYAHDFDAIYGNNNGLVDSVINRLFRQSMKLRYLKTLEGSSPIAGCSVLDIGCGPGHYSIALAKLGAGEVLGIDVAEGMLRVARERAARESGAQVCRFEKRDFLLHDFDRKFDYTILMGLMDYMERPRDVVKKALSITATRSFFSFPLDDGILAWQRKFRYKSRCELYMYKQAEVRNMFLNVDCAGTRIEKIGRDLFIAVDMK